MTPKGIATKTLNDLPHSLSCDLHILTRDRTRMNGQNIRGDRWKSSSTAINGN